VRMLTIILLTLL